MVSRQTEQGRSEGTPSSFRFFQSDRVGLDIGRFAIKAVRIRRFLAGQQSVTYFHQTLPRRNGQPLDEGHLASILRRFLSHHRLTEAPIITAFSCKDLFLRTLTLPFQDPKKLTQVVPFEIEPQLPVPLETVEVSSLVLGPFRTPDNGAEGSSGVLVAVAPKEKVEQALNFFASSGLEPDAIQVDALALFATTEQLRREGSKVPHNLAIVDIGASKTTICLTHHGRPWLLRTLPWGGDVFTEVIMERLNCSFSEAERDKRGLSVEQCGSLLHALIAELQRSLHAYEAQTHTRLTRVWFCGGGSRLKGLPLFIGRQLDLKPLGTKSGFGVDCPRTFSVAFGLAAKVSVNPSLSHLHFHFPATPGQSINLKKELPSQPPLRPAGTRWHNQRLLIAGSVLLIILGLGNLFASVSLKKASAQSLTRQIHAQFQTFFGTTAQEGLVVEQAHGLVTAASQKTQALGGHGPAVLETMGEVLGRIPKGTALTISMLSVEDSLAQLEGDTDSFDSLEKISRSLKASSHLTEVTVSDSRIGIAPNQVLFRITMKVAHP